MPESLPDYYAILNIPETATADRIRDAYKREALLTHPDRHPNLSEDEARARFQQIADAYFTLSDPARRQRYDQARRRNRAAPSADAGDIGGTWRQQQANAERVFGDVFQDLLAPEVERPQWIWTPLGAICGAVIGFIIGNLPGAILGGVGGAKLGTIRDNKGKSVYAAFQQLSREQKSALLSKKSKDYRKGGHRGKVSIEKDLTQACISLEKKKQIKEIKKQKIVSE
ncbi:uncharacterized protein VTP21DRAFT_832 [Calcarisporiella thermophila]|uniref:uncharacterized protein n=1 Tax=Calcarisporiella thermophila TaxID=911321 RepID=UPI003743799E